MRMWKCIASDESYFIVGKIYPEAPDGRLNDEDSLGKTWDKGNPYMLAPVEEWNEWYPEMAFTEVTFELYLKEIEDDKVL